MSLFAVTTAQTVYEGYSVEAVNEVEAMRLVRAQISNGGTLTSIPTGDGDDETVIAVREVRRS